MTDQPTTTELAVVTYNAGNASDSRFYADLDRAEREGAQIIELQEVADRAMVLGRWARINGWTLHQETIDDKGHVAVLVAPGIKILDRGYWRCTKRTPVGAWGAGPAVIAAKWIAWVTIEHGGRVETVASTHFVPSVQRPAHGRAAVTARARRISIWSRHVGALLAWLLVARGAKIIGFDGNATTRFPLMAKMARLVLRTAASHGKRAIDMLRSTRRRWLKVGPARALNGYSSDHKPVMVVYTITAPRRRGGARRA